MSWDMMWLLSVVRRSRACADAFDSFEVGQLLT